MRIQNTDTITRFYKETLKKHPRGVKSYRWARKREQEARFEELSKVIKFKASPRKILILDVGSGRGDLNQYFIDKGIKTRYTGIDLVPEFISDAKNNYPKARFIEKDFLEWRSNTRFDYVVASGLLSVKISDNEKYLRDAVKKMLQLARRGVSFNFLTTFRREKFKRWYYYNPGQILNWCFSLKKIKHLMISSGYDPSDRFGDATVLLFK